MEKNIQAYATRENVGALLVTLVVASGVFAKLSNYMDRKHLELAGHNPSLTYLYAGSGSDLGGNSSFYNFANGFAKIKVELLGVGTITPKEPTKDCWIQVSTYNPIIEDQKYGQISVPDWDPTSTMPITGSPSFYYTIPADAYTGHYVQGCPAFQVLGNPKSVSIDVETWGSLGVQIQEYVWIRYYDGTVETHYQYHTGSYNQISQGNNYLLRVIRNGSYQRQKCINNDGSWIDC